jgi:hypothetical protein
MNFKTACITLTLAALSISSEISAQARNLPVLPPLPSGFQTPDNYKGFPWKGTGMGDGLEGVKKNDLSSCFGSPKLAHLSYSWTNGGMQMVIDGMMREPEKPAFKDGAWHQNEPAGKMAYRGGVLEMRKIIYSPDIGIDAKGQCGATLDTYDATWTAVAAGKMLQIEVHMFAGSRDAAKVVIDGLIDPLKAAVSKTK